MMLKNSVKSLIRTPLKTILFIVLLCAVTVFLILGISMKLSSQSMLDKANEEFSTVAQLDYMGANYPDTSYYDSRLDDIQKNFDYSKLMALDEVVSFEHNSRMNAYIGPFEYNALEKPYQDDVVIVFKVKSEGDNGLMAILQKTVYDFKEISQGAMFTLLESPYQPNGGYKMGHTYVGYGKFFYNNRSRQVSFYADKFDTKQITMQEWFTFVQPYGYGRGYESGMDEELQSYRDAFGLLNQNVCDITDNVDEAVAEIVLSDMSLWQWDKPNEVTYSQIFKQIARTYQVINNSLPLTATDSVKDMPEFHQGTSYFTEGGAYTAKDGKYVCVISEMVSKQKGLNIGDMLEINAHYAKGESGFSDSYWAASGFDFSHEYKIVGIYKTSDEENLATIYIPKDKWVPENTVSYILGRFIIKNGSGLDLIQKSEELLGSRMTLTVYDQGFMTVAAPLNSMNETSDVLLVSCAVCGACIILLFAFMFVTRQNVEIHTMLALGSGEHRVRAYLMFSVVILALVAVGIAAALGYLFCDKVLQTIYDSSVRQATIDLRYSTFVMKSVDDFIVTFNTDTRLIFGSAAVVLLLSMLMAFILTNNALSKKRTDDLRNFPAHMRRALHRVGQALRQIIRNPGRSIIVPAVSLVIAVILCIFVFTLDNYDNKLASVYDSSEVKAYFTSTNGSKLDGLLLSGDDVNAVTETGFVEKTYCSYNLQYLLEGYTRTTPAEKKGDNPIVKYTEAMGTPEIPPVRQTFAYERFMASVVLWENVIFTNDLYHTPEFFFDNQPEVVYAKGYDASMYQSKEMICALSTKTALEWGIQLGDDITISIATRAYGAFNIESVTFKVVSLFVNQGIAQNIYCPIDSLTSGIGGYSFLKGYAAYATGDNSNYIDVVEDSGYNDDALARLLGTDEKKENVSDELERCYYSSLSTICFDLKNTENLDELKQWLTENGYGTRGYLGKNRKTIIIDDSALISATTGLEKIINYMKAVFPLILVIVIGIGFVVSYLLTRGRRAELAIMRSMGAGSARAFLVFFIEQIIMVLSGCILGTVFASFIITHTFSLHMLYILLIYVGCYLGGCAVAIIMMNRGNVLRLLSAGE